MARRCENPGRVIDDFINFADFAPTILDLAGIPQDSAGMQAIEGKSFKNILFSGEAGKTDDTRNFMLVGKERHDVGRPNDQGYPIRGIRTSKYLYLKNYETSRWPSGNPETGYLNCDGGATKSTVLNSRTLTNADYWQLNFGKRPAEELYDLENDPDCVNNLAENQIFDKLKEKLEAKMVEELKAQGDPRMFGKGDIFDEYEVCFPNLKNFYNRYMSGEEMQANWVNKSDFELIDSK